MPVLLTAGAVMLAGCIAYGLGCDAKRALENQRMKRVRRRADRDWKHDEDTWGKPLWQVSVPVPDDADMEQLRMIAAQYAAIARTLIEIQELPEAER